MIYIMLLEKPPAVRVKPTVSPYFFNNGTLFYATVNSL